MKVQIQKIDHLGEDRWRAHILVDGRATIMEVELEDDVTVWTSYFTDRRYQVIKNLERLIAQRAEESSPRSSAG